VSVKGLAEAVLEYDEALRTAGFADTVITREAALAFRNHRGKSLEDLYEVMVGRAREIWAPLALIGDEECADAIDRANAAACLLSESEARIQLLSAAYALLKRNEPPASIHHAINTVVMRMTAARARTLLEDILSRTPIGPNEPTQ
jgi:hypothetical protein